MLNHHDRQIGSVWLRTSAPNLDVDPLTLVSVRDDHLRAANGTAENAYIGRLISVSLAMCERVTRRYCLTQPWRHQLDMFPRGHWGAFEYATRAGALPHHYDQIVIGKAPLQEVTSITYIDPDGATQTLDESLYEVENPSVETNEYARIRLAYNANWPATRFQPRAVTINTVLGYPTSGSPELAVMPDELTHGRLLLIAELYKQRSESVHDKRQELALIRARDLFQAWKVY